MTWFHREVCAALQQFYDDVEAGKSPRLMIFAPPQHGKSELFSRRFPAWCFGKNPDLRIISASYGSQLARKMNRDIQRIMEEKSYNAVFASARINSKNVVTTRSALKNANEFQVIKQDGNIGGYYFCTGVGGSMTGISADIIIIDDPVRGMEDANSELKREKNWDWLTSVAMTRLSPKGGIILGLTRWHEDDLAGRLLGQYPNDWRVIKFPAIAEEDESNRKEGEALTPERYSLAWLKEKENAVGSYTWNALYQQRPSAKGGDLIKAEYFDLWERLPKITEGFITADTASKTKTYNDFSVFSCWGVSEDHKLFLLDMRRGKWTGGELAKQARQFWKEMNEAFYELQGRPSLCAMFIEDKSSGIGLIQEFQEKGDVVVSPIARHIDKFTRCISAQPVLEQKKVLLRNNAPWLDAFLKECTSFSANNSHKHDDQVDTLLDAVEILRRGRTTL